MQRMPSKLSLTTAERRAMVNRAVCGSDPPCASHECAHAWAHAVPADVLQHTNGKTMVFKIPGWFVPFTLLADCLKPHAAAVSHAVLTRAEGSQPSLQMLADA